jgi:hypothetical protein
LPWPLALFPLADTAYMVVDRLYAESNAPYAVVGLGLAPLRTASDGVNLEWLGKKVFRLSLPGLNPFFPTFGL